MVISTLALGSVQWGMPYGVANRTGQPALAEVERILDVAAAAGIRTIDTARAYGTSESVIGQLVGADAGWRVVTKIDPGVDDVETEQDALSRLRHSLDESHRCLRRSTLDVVLLHRPRQRTAFGGALWRSLLQCRDRGEVGALGVSASTPAEALEAVAADDVDVMQVAASLVDQRLFRAGFFSAAREQAVEVFVRSAFLQGALLAPSSSLPVGLAPLGAVVERLRAQVEGQGLSWPLALLAVVERVFGARPVVGIERATQLEELVAPGAIDDELLRALDVPVLADELLDPARWAGR